MLVRRIGARAGGGNGASSRHSIAIYDSPKKVERIFGSFAFALRDFHGAGYGPPTFGGTPLISELRAKKLSRALSQGVRAARLEPLAKWYADISVYVFERLP
jgi:hypothetical protein